jgi:uncharacterized protein HemY
MPSTTVPASDADDPLQEQSLEAASAGQALDGMQSSFTDAQDASPNPSAAATAGAAAPLSSPAAPAALLEPTAPQQQQQQPEQQLQLAALLLDRGRFRDAATALQPLLAAQPGHVSALCLQGRCLAAIGSRPQVSKECGTASESVNGAVERVNLL